MKQNDDHLLMDELIGEAVLSLLPTREPINTQTLIERLNIMQTVTRDPKTRKILDKIIFELDINIRISPNEVHINEQQKSANFCFELLSSETKHAANNDKLY